MASYDAIIIGAGMVGMATAIGLAQSGLNVALVDKMPLSDQTLPTFDGRVSAIALASKRLLDNLGIWQSMAAHAEPIMDIRVVDSSSPFYLHYDYEEVGDEPFGWIVQNRHTRCALLEKLHALSSHIALYAPDSIATLDQGIASNNVTLKSGKALLAPLLIVADGKFSKTREMMGVPAQTIPYDHTAIVCTIAHEKPHHGLALERFFGVGPFAVLPMQGQRSSLVWTEKHDMAKHMVSLPEDDLAEEIYTRTDGYLGNVSIEGRCFSYPLSLVFAKDYTANRAVLIGDAAHGIHPIAGQGVNLGFRDVAALVEVLTKAKRLGLDMGSQVVLADYSKWRSFDAASMVVVTDGINRLFSNNNTLLSAARKTGLATVSKIPPLKQFYMRHAMGLTGDVPKLMQERNG